MGALYLITGPSGKEYIGITMRSADLRLAEHKTWGVRRSNSYLHAAMRKHGAESFSLKTLVIADDWQYLCDLERKAIAAFGCKAPNGYNATDGGDGVPGMDEETKEKHRANTSAGTAKAWAEGKMDGREKTWADPAFQERHRQATSEGVKRMYADPEKRAKTLAALKSDSKRASNRAASQKVWADPEKREKMLATLNRPDLVAKRVSGAKAYWAKKRAEKTNSLHED
jgi:hypothetical protein